MMKILILKDYPKKSIFLMIMRIEKNWSRS
jgi:hypothetical protein